jgi:AcrR family transcriptional regulator
MAVSKRVIDDEDEGQDTVPAAVITGGRGDRRREAVLDAATAEFLARGYEGASLRAIIRGGGGSSETLYRQFGSKEGLFRAVVERMMVRGFQPSIALGESDRPLEDELLAFGCNYLEEFTAPEALAFFRMMVAEATLIPETTRRLWEIGPFGAIQRLEAYLRRQARLGQVEIEDYPLAAAQFMDMIKGGLHIRMLLVGIQPTQAEIVASVRQAVRIFCDGVRRR